MADEFEFPIGSCLQEIWAIADRELGGDEILLDEVRLIFPEAHVILQPLIDTDEIDIIIKPCDRENEIFSGDRTSITGLYRSPGWSSFLVGQKLQTVWVCENQQGYRDRVSFAFKTLRPSIEFICEGSVMSILRYYPMKQEQVEIMSPTLLRE